MKWIIVDVCDFNWVLMLMLDKGEVGVDYNVGGLIVYEMGDVFK